MRNHDDWRIVGSLTERPVLARPRISAGPGDAGTHDVSRNAGGCARRAVRCSNDRRCPSTRSPSRARASLGCRETDLETLVARASTGGLQHRTQPDSLGSVPAAAKRRPSPPTRAAASSKRNREACATAEQHCTLTDSEPCTQARGLSRCCFEARDMAQAEQRLRLRKACYVSVSVSELQWR
eukprot:3941538-Rhodomonas_salina.4